MSSRCVLSSLVWWSLVGCGGTPGERSSLTPQTEAARREGDGATKNDPAGADPAAVGATPQPQMVAYTATLDVVVKDLDTAAPDVEKLVAAHKGLVARSEVKGDAGSRRTATYTVRVPVAGFGALRDALLALGTPERNVTETQDVTEEFIDVEARIKNLQDQERKLNELLKEKRKEEKLEDVIKVSDRIYLVRGDIERAQGRRNYLLNRVQLSTINLTLREIKDYKPPTAPTFGTRVRDAFGNSWDAVVDFGKGAVLVCVALAPWAPILVPVLLALAWGVRRLVRSSRESAGRAPAEREQHARHLRPHGNEPGAVIEPQSHDPKPLG